MNAFAGKVAVVTGGARGLGRETALELARRGARVAVVDRKTDGAGETAKQCSEYTAGSAAYEMDQADASSVERCIAAVADGFGHIDALFANAGTGKFAPLVDMAKSDWDLIIQINLNGAFYVCQEVARKMIAQGSGGSIVLTASSGARVIADQLGAYCASKAGVVMLMKHLASELGNYRINVNAVLPGVIETGMTNPMLSRDEWKRMLVRQTPSGRWGKALDVAKLVAFLLSPDAGFINGEGIMIDGGSTLHGFPRWYALDYSRQNEISWNAMFAEYPYAAEASTGRSDPPS